ncbi:hypothetical protein PSU4_46160 [Pseudonocardia sulfidoxydans NBRC 16205]|uniref:Uncharacterized protein n=1 Tax=Pseudonocardia sulfidoxydans NBRC 16205 TaxID=1223511 RepID=A0A511DLH6_9PSEU|nr:hypothetical protein [Pseudonocardia sulfidoxydans]GEL25662.1 hypothetical protein PSU4_46160 [Pseudonocardia sulfidoxydans NBRC 16205]
MNATPLELVDCPACGAPAEVVDRFTLSSTDGPVEHVKVRCVLRHHFTMLAEPRRTPQPDGEAADRIDPSQAPGTGTAQSRPET